MHKRASVPRSRGAQASVPAASTPDSCGRRGADAFCTDARSDVSSYTNTGASTDDSTVACANGYACASADASTDASTGACVYTSTDASTKCRAHHSVASGGLQCHAAAPSGLRCPAAPPGGLHCHAAAPWRLRCSAAAVCGLRCWGAARGGLRDHTAAAVRGLRHAAVPGRLHAAQLLQVGTGARQLRQVSFVPGIRARRASGSCSCSGLASVLGSCHAMQLRLRRWTWSAVRVGGRCRLAPAGRQTAGSVSRRLRGPRRQHLHQH